MDKGKVISILSFFKTIDNEIKFNDREIRDIEETYYNPLRAVDADGMPHGKGGVSSTTETTALNVPASARDSLDELNRQNQRLRLVKREILREMSAIGYTYKAVLYDFYVKEFQWVRISEQIHYSPRQCQNFRDIGLELLARRFVKNKVISKFTFPS